MNEPFAAVGGRLRAHRVVHGWTLSTLAARAGISVLTLARYEHGRVQPDLTHLEDLASAMVLDPEEFDALVQLAGYAP